MKNLRFLLLGLATLAGSAPAFADPAQALREFLAELASNPRPVQALLRFNARKTDQLRRLLVPLGYTQDKEALRARLSALKTFGPATFQTDSGPRSVPAIVEYLINPALPPREEIRASSVQVVSLDPKGNQALALRSTVVSVSEPEIRLHLLGPADPQDLATVLDQVLASSGKAPVYLSGDFPSEHPATAFLVETRRGVRVESPLTEGAAPTIAALQEALRSPAALERVTRNFKEPQQFEVFAKWFAKQNIEFHHDLGGLNLRWFSEVVTRFYVASEAGSAGAHSAVERIRAAAPEAYRVALVQMAFEAKDPKIVASAQGALGGRIHSIYAGLSHPSDAIAGQALETLAGMNLPLGAEHRPALEALHSRWQGLAQHRDRIAVVGTLLKRLAASTACSPSKVARTYIERSQPEKD